MTTQEKAKAALAARDMGDPRWHFLREMLAIVTNLNPMECERRIEALARGEG